MSEIKKGRCQSCGKEYGKYGECGICDDCMAGGMRC